MLFWFISRTLIIIQVLKIIGQQKDPIKIVEGENQGFTIAEKSERVIVVGGTKKDILIWSKNEFWQYPLNLL